MAQNAQILTYGGIYNTGIVTVVQGSPIVNGVGALFTNVILGDYFVCNGLVGVILSVDASYKFLTLMSPWQGSSSAGNSYVVILASYQRYDPAITQSQVRQLIALLTGGNQLPAPSNGQLVIASTTQIKFKTLYGNAYQSGGALYQIPAAGIVSGLVGVNINAVANQNLAANTTYLVSVDSTGVMSFWTASTYAHGEDSTPSNIGVEVITFSGAPITTATFLGTVTTNSVPNFVNVVSWFNSPTITAATAPTQRLITGAGALPILTTDQRLNINISATLVIALPAYGSRAGVPLTFKDVGGTLSNTVQLQLNGSGGDLVDGNSGVALKNPRQEITLYPATDGTTTGYSIG